MNYKNLCLIFGITLSVCSCSVNWMLKKVVRLLRGHPFARVNFPNGEKMREYANMVRMREPMLEDIIGFMDSVFLTASAPMIVSNKMQYNVVTIATQWSTMCLHMAPMGRCFLLQLTFLEVGYMEV